MSRSDRWTLPSVTELAGFMLRTRAVFAFRTASDPPEILMRAVPGAHCLTVAEYVVASGDVDAAALTGLHRGVEVTWTWSVDGRAIDPVTLEPV